MADGQVVFEISADNRDALRAIDQTTDALEDAGREWESNAGESADSISDKFTDMFKKISAAAVAAKVGDALLSFGKDAIQAASDLEEVQNVVDTTFGAGASRINEWAKTASTSFGLTELQAKQFTSTLGAMMKSSGLAGDQIIDMSTDLAGLAADMASFYNLDFETAFQKIRSGISGETEPLKQLGINMSVVNLEAFALTQGITKAFSEMSQGEQTMLRYQYIMQATADAQGDFARTSDGYANSMRKLETQVDNLKAKMGKPLLDVIGGATNFLNDFIDTIVGEEKPKTLLDKVADIDIQKELKIADIKAVASEAEGLLLSLNTISEELGASGDITGYFSDVSGSISAFDDMLLTNTIEQNLGNLADNLNPTVKNDGEFADSLDKLEGSIDGIDTTISETQNGITSGLGAITNAIPTSATLGDNAAETMGKVESAVKSLGDQLDTSDDIEEKIGNIADGMNPTITNDGEFAGSLDELKGSIDGLDTTIADTKNGITSGMSAIAGAIDADATDGDDMKKSLESVATGIGTLSDKTDEAGEIESALGGLADNLNPAITNDGLFAESLSELGGSVDDLGTDLDNNVNSIKSGIKDISDAIPTDGKAGDNANKAFGQVAAGITTLDGAVATAQNNDVIEGMKSLANGFPSDATAGNAAKTAFGDVASGVEDLTGAVNSAGGVSSGLDGLKSAVEITPDESSLTGSLDSVSESVKDLNVRVSNAKTNDVAGKLADLAAGLSVNLGGDANKWTNLLQAISGNAAQAIAATSGDTGATATFLESVAAGADDLTTDYSEYWGNLLGALGDNAGDAISALATEGDAGAVLTAIAGGANSLASGTADEWSAFVSAIDGIKISDAKGLQGVANALATNVGGDAKKWSNLLSAIKDNAGDALAAIGDNDGSITKAFLENVAAGADDYTTDYSTYWANLLSVLGDNAGAAISALDGGSEAGAAVESIAKGANALNSSSSGVWAALLGTLQTIDGLSNIFTDSAAGNVSDLAAALSNDAPDSTRADAWKTFLDALGANAGALSTLTGESAEQTAEWLRKMKEAVEGLDPTDANAWDTLLKNFVGGLPGLTDTSAGEGFFTALVQNFLAMGSQSEVARQGLAALGYESDDIAAAQKNWLTVCKQLVSTIPELNGIINTETGEIKGGTQAVQEYIKAWENDSILKARIDALKQMKEELLAEINGDYEKEVIKARANVYMALKKYIGEDYARAFISGYGNGTFSFQSEGHKGYIQEQSDDWMGGAMFVPEYVTEAIWAYDAAVRDKASAEYDAKVVAQDLDEQITALSEEYGIEREEALKMIEAEAEMASANAELAASVENVQSVLENATNAFKELADYQERVRDETEQSIKSTITGFEKIETAGQKARKTFAEITKGENESAEAYNKRYTEAQNAVPSLQKMTQGLQSQLEYMQEYQNLLTQARAKGVSEDLLATLSDGSQESFDYLYALVHTEGSIEALNQAYADVQEEASKFTDELTKQKLAVDEAYKSMVETAQEAVAGLNVSEKAYASVEDTVNAIANALSDNKEKVQKQVDAILAQIARLSMAGGYGSVPTWGGGIGFTRVWAGKAANTDGSNANGIDNVPFDGYLALLHQGERVQTAAEADLARRYSYQQPAFDYDAMGGAIGSNIPRGNVYLDGQTVGRVIGDRQANSYRALERSGWQA